MSTASIKSSFENPKTLIVIWQPMSLIPVSGRIEHNSVRIIKIISGGQTGVDRAALDVAIELGFEYGGFCPKGRLAEDGVILNKYNLTELSNSQYLMRTIANVQASDGTLIIHQGTVSGGTLKTKDYCQMINKSFFTVNLLEDLEKIPLNFDTWIKENHIIIMNIAGPRESAAPIYNRTYTLLMDLLSHYKR